MTNTPSDKAHAHVERLFALLYDVRATARDLELGHKRDETKLQEAERLLYFGLMGALEAGLVRTMEDTLAVLRQASQPLGPMGEAWLCEQERALGRGDDGPMATSGGTGDA